VGFDANDSLVLQSEACRYEWLTFDDVSQNVTIDTEATALSARKKSPAFPGTIRFYMGLNLMTAFKMPSEVTLQIPLVNQTR
jgi:hypothetical protein